MHPHQPIHPDAIYDAENRARETLVRNIKAAANAQKLLASAGCFLPDKKIVGIKHLRETLGLGLKEAKDAWEIAFDLRAVA